MAPGKDAGAVFHMKIERQKDESSVCSHGYEGTGQSSKDIGRTLRVRKDIVFDEMGNWYNIEKVYGIDLDEIVVVENMSQDS